MLKCTGKAVVRGVERTFSGRLHGVLQLKKHIVGSLSEVLRTPRARGLMGLHGADLGGCPAHETPRVSPCRARSSSLELGKVEAVLPPLLFHPLLWPLICCFCLRLLPTSRLDPFSCSSYLKQSLSLSTFPAAFFQVSATSWRLPPCHLSFLEAFLVELLWLLPFSLCLRILHNNFVFPSPICLLIGGWRCRVTPQCVHTHLWWMSNLKLFMC